MNRLIIVGNGFDLSLGLKTSYKDFLFEYFKDCLKKSTQIDTYNVDQSGHNHHFKDELIEIKIPITEMLTTEVFGTVESFSNYDETIKFLTENNYVTFYFDLLEEIVINSYINNWIDIEIFYYDLLVSKLEVKNRIEREEILKEHNEKFELLKSKFIDYLKTIQFNLQQDRFYEFIYNYFIKIFEEPFVDKEKEINEKFENIMFLNFNYTPFLSKSLKFLHFKNSFINHIHGNLSDEESIIFGFGDEHDKDYQTIESERSQELFKNIKSVHYFRKPNYKQLKSFIESDFFDVYIVGHSCGISDRTLFNEIFEYKNQNGIEHCLSVKILHHRMDNGKTDFLEKSIEIMRHFKDKQKMRSKIQTFNENDQIPQFNMR